ncbi:MAG: hypothetical protein MUF45_15195 [Spirosomaceae bacterium]|jgi:hypothetical protein|nr:hypothetical protein [Spirosomataceae bacterium]
MKENKVKSELIQFRCSTEDKETLTKIAEQKGKDISKYLRDLVQFQIRLAKTPKVKTVTSVTAVTDTNRNESGINMDAVKDLLWILGGVFGIFLLFRVIALFNKPQTPYNYQGYYGSYEDD